MNRDWCRSKSCQDTKITACLFFNGVRKASPERGRERRGNPQFPFRKANIFPNNKTELQAKTEAAMLYSLAKGLILKSFSLLCWYKNNAKGQKKGTQTRGGNSQNQLWNCTKAGTRLKACVPLTYEVTTQNWAQHISMLSRGYWEVLLIDVQQYVKCELISSLFFRQELYSNLSHARYWQDVTG